MTRAFVVRAVVALAVVVLSGIVAATNSPVLGLDLRGGTQITLQVQDSPNSRVKATPRTTDRVLAVLRNRQIVSGRKDGNQVFYSLRDPILGKVLNLMRQYFESHLKESLELLKDIDSETHVAR